MNLKTDMAADLATFFNEDEFADPGVYNDGDDHPISVILDEAGGGDTGRHAARAQAQVLMAEVPAPQYRQTIAVGGVTWTIDQAPGRAGYPNDGFVWILPVTRDQKVRSWRK